MFQPGHHQLGQWLSCRGLNEEFTHGPQIPLLAVVFYAVEAAFHGNDSTARDVVGEEVGILLAYHFD